MDGPFFCEGGFIRDALGRVRVFHGANVSGRAKLPPFRPLSRPELLDPLRRWGFNIVRLLLSWEALEPRRGELDTQYLDDIVSLASEAGARGLHVIVDFHQDLYSRQFGGDGAPPWAIARKGRRIEGRLWFLNYFVSGGVRGSQDAFWADHDGIQSAFLGTARQVMERMREVEGVIGYDMWNEPMSGVAALVRGDFEGRWLPEFYRACIRMRDEVDPTRLLFIEPLPLAAFGVPTRLADVSGPRLVFAPHLYDATAIVTGRYRPRFSTFPLALARLERVASRLGLPILIGEFGALNRVADAERMLEHECRLLDRRLCSWTVWHYDPGEVDWNDEAASIVDADTQLHPWAAPLRRPYAIAIAGANATCKVRRGTWELAYAPAGAESTEVAIPPSWRDATLDVVGAQLQRCDDGLSLTPRRGSSHVVVTLTRAD